MMMNQEQCSTKTDMLHFVIKIADINIKINALSSGTYGYCINYLTNDKPDIEVSINESDIDELVLISLNENGIVNRPYLETIAIYNKIVEKMLNYDCFLMHGAVVAIQDEAWMFSANSGTGKTTHVKLWLKKIKEAYIVNGDKPIIKIYNGQAFACGTPWYGKERLGTNTMVPLKGIAFLKRSESNSIHRISFAQAYPFLLQQVYLPKDPEKAKATLQLLKRLGNLPHYYIFHVNNFNSDCLQVSYNAMVNDND